MAFLVVQLTEKYHMKIRNIKLTTSDYSKPVCSQKIANYFVTKDLGVNGENQHEHI